MPVGLGRLHPFTLAKRLRLTWPIIEEQTGITRETPTQVPMVRVLRESIARRRHQWAVSRRQTPLVYMTCMAMFGNGVLTIGMRTMEVSSKRLLLMEAPGQRMEIIHSGCCVAVLGTAFLGTAARRSASGTFRATGAALLACGLFAVRRGLLNISLPFTLLPFALDSFFFRASRDQIFLAPGS